MRTSCAAVSGFSRGSAGVMPRFSLLGDRHAQVSLGIAVLASVAVAFAASPLPRVTPDSASYLTGAERIAESGRFESCVGPITLFAPGYSAAMAPLVAVGARCTRRGSHREHVLATLALVLGAGCLAAGRRFVTNRLGHRRSRRQPSRTRPFATEPSSGRSRCFCAILVWLLTLAVERGRGLDVRFSTRLAAVLLLAWALLLTRHSGVFLLPAVVLAAWLGSSTSTDVAAPASEPSALRWWPCPPCGGFALPVSTAIRSDDARSRASPCSRSSTSSPTG